MARIGEQEAEKFNASNEDGGAAKKPNELFWAFGVARRQALLISAGCAAGLGYGVYSMHTLTPSYTATSVMLFSSPKLNAVRELYNGDIATAIDAAAFDSQVEILRSDKLARTVIGKLNLMTNPPSPVASQPGLLTRAISTLRIGGAIKGDAAPPPTREALEADRLRDMVNTLRERLTIRRIRQSWVVEFSFTSSDPELAARIANGYSDAYLADQVDAKYEATRQAGGWLEEQIGELKQKSVDTELAIQRVKTTNNLFSSGNALVDENRFADVNKQLMEIQAEVTRLDARYNHIRSIITEHRTEAVVSEIIGNPLIESLRSKYLDASKRATEISRIYGKDHEQAIKLRKDMQECETFMFNELVRISENYRNELEIASARQKALNESAGKITGKTSEDNATLTELRNLERKADTYKNLHRTALQRYEEVLQAQSFPFGGARQVSPAIAPSKPNQSAKSQFVLMSLAFGGAVGGGLGALWELADRSFRTGDQVRAELDLDYFGPLYRVEFKPEKTRSFARIRALLRAKLASRISVANEKTEAQLPSAVLDHAVRNPQSTFADTLNAIHIGASQSPAKHKTKVIGIVSTLPGEGKSVVAHNFAALLADMGLHALLIDANLRNPALTRFLAPNAEQGLIEAVCEGAPLTRTAARQADSRLDFLPAARPERAPHSSEFLASAGMKTLLEHAEEHYDYVIVDLPPMTAIVDSRAIAPLMDHFVLVVEWGRTDRNAVIRALQVDKQIRAKCLGVVLNKVDLRAMKLYEPAGSRDYYFDQCNQYHEKPITT